MAVRRTAVPLPHQNVNTSMIDSIISFSIRNKFVIFLLVAGLIVGGTFSLQHIKLGSVPDITNNQVQVITVAPNLGTVDIEQFVTYPVELAMANLPGVIELRSISRFGLSVVTIVFEDHMGTYLPRQLVQEKLAEVSEAIPEGFGTPFMAPITTGLGEIYQYTLVPEPGYEDRYSPMELRTIQDWIVRRQMALVPGVVEINSFGGYLKQYEVALNPDRLNSFGITIGEVFEALQRNNANTGGAYIERNHQANFIRGEGLVRSLDELGLIPVALRDDTPILLKDVAEDIRFGNAVRYGAFTQDGREAVGGQVLMLKGENPNEVIRNVKRRMEEIQKSLPEGLRIEPFIDRSALIARTTSTVKKNLIEGALIVVFVLVLLLGSLRGGLITASIIPLSLLFAFILMYVFDVWANLMSLGAIDFGIIVDGAVIIVEGTVLLVERHLRQGRTHFSSELMDKLAFKAGSTMMNSAFFGQLIILIVFAPILFLTGIEGKMFRPMAFTFGFAVLGAILLCLTYVPAMCAVLLKPPREGSRSPMVRFEQHVHRWSERLMRALNRLYDPLLSAALRHRVLTLLLAVGLFGSAVYTFTRMGGEFVPKLDEGDIAMQALVKPGSSLSESIEMSKRIQRILLDSFPEVKSVLARIGVAEIPTDPMPMDIADCFIVMEKDKSKWVSAKTKKELIEKMKEKLSVLPGVNFIFTQPVELRFNELLTGVREDVAVKLYGEDLDILAKKAQEMARIISTVPGAADVRAEATSGLPQIVVRYRRERLARYGLDVAKLNDYLSTAFSGGMAGTIFEGERRFDLVVRLAESYRHDIDQLRALLIDLPNGTQVPLQEVADIRYEPGPMQISRDNTSRRIYVGVNVRGRDVESVVRDIQARLDADLDLPPGYYIVYGGSFENLMRAKQRLTVVVPIALALIFLLLYFALGSVVQSILIYMAVPLATIGGVYSLWLRGMPFSISAGVGFIVLFGVAVLNGLVLINRLNSLKEAGQTDLMQRIHEAAHERLRPILLTAVAAIMGFTPMALSTSAGAEVQRPLATVVIGGLITATLLTLVVLPVLYYLVERWSERRTNGRAPLTAMGTVLLVATFSGTLQAQPAVQVVSLEEARELARQNYPSLQAAMAGVQRDEALLNTAFNPGVTNVGWGIEELGPANDAIATLGFNQSGIDLFGRKPMRQWLDSRLEQSRQRYRLTEQELMRQVAQAWYRLSWAKGRLQVFAQLDSIYAAFEEASTARFEAQEIDRLALLAARSRYHQVALMRRQAADELEVAREALRRYLGVQAVVDVPADSVLLWAPVEALDTTLLAVHPLLQVARQQVAAAQAFVAVQRARLKPSFNVGVGPQVIGGQFGFYSFQAGVNFPLFAKPWKARIEAAEAEVLMSQRLLEQQKVELYSLLLRQYQQYLKVSRAIAYYREIALPLAHAQMEAATESYRLGQLDYVSWIQNMDTALQSQLDYLDLLRQYNDLSTTLRYLLGMW